MVTGPDVAVKACDETGEWNMTGRLRVTVSRRLEPWVARVNAFYRWKAGFIVCVWCTMLFTAGPFEVAFLCLVLPGLCTLTGMLLLLAWGSYCPFITSLVRLLPITGEELACMRDTAIDGYVAYAQQVLEQDETVNVRFACLVREADLLVTRVMHDLRLPL